MAEAHVQGTEDTETTRRDFLYIATGAAAVVGAGAAVWPFIDQMNAAANVSALASIEVDLSPIEVGQTIKVMWQGKPVYVRHRTAAQIQEAEAVALDELPDPQADSERVEKSEWLVMVGVCTHLGCIPIDDPDNAKGQFNGWFCPCHGSHYDGSGRIRKGPAPENLAVPPYQFVSDTQIVIG